MGFLSFLFGAKAHKITSFLNNGAVILDVRTQREWDKGHIDQSIHIPLNELSQRLDEIKILDTPIITCCESGVRSAKASSILKQNDITSINGGGWLSVKAQL